MKSALTLNLEALGGTLQRVRKVAGVSQVNLGKHLNLHQAAVSRIESGTQNLTPFELFQFGKLFGVGVDSLLSGQVNVWAVAEKFGRKPPLPAPYLSDAHTKMREVLPLFRYISADYGKDKLQKLLSSLSLEEMTNGAPDQAVGALAWIDLLSQSVTNGYLSDSRLESYMVHARSREVHGVLSEVYESHKDPLRLVESFILNATFYEHNFEYLLEEAGAKQAVVSMQPCGHMKSVPYKSPVLGDFLCRYRRAYWTTFPKIASLKPLRVVERECHFKGAKRCLYELRTA